MKSSEIKVGREYAYQHAQDCTWPNRVEVLAVGVEQTVRKQGHGRFGLLGRDPRTFKGIKVAFFSHDGTPTMTDARDGRVATQRVEVVEARYLHMTGLRAGRRLRTHAPPSGHQGRLESEGAGGATGRSRRLGPFCVASEGLTGDADFLPARRSADPARPSGTPSGFSHSARSAVPLSWRQPYASR